VRLALPKGRLQQDTASLLERGGVGVEGYDGSARTYRLTSSAFPDLKCRIFQERDIPVQVAIGNYNLGVCGRDWVEELMARYPSEDLMVLRDLDYGRCELYAAASSRASVSSVGEINRKFDRVRIVSEYPNLAEAFAMKQRFKRFSILPICGAGEAYPPESADLAVIAATSPDYFDRHDLVPLERIVTSRACVIANRRGLSQSDHSRLLTCLQPADPCPAEEWILPVRHRRVKQGSAKQKEAVRLALPDGHLSITCAGFLDRAGVKLDGYGGRDATRRPTIDIPGTSVKVIRPQDMPLQVANDSFDLAITGEDWLLDHLYRFPTSPVEKILTLGFGAVRLVVVGSADFPAKCAGDLRELARKGTLPLLRVASEYVNIADRYVLDNHLARCKIIPTWGASEAFIPDDADLLIENTETGETLKRHNLKIIDTILQSSACLIGRRGILSHGTKKRVAGQVVEILKQGLQ